jgi:integrative and conjugative element protein (TIGR02256 family)
MKILLPKDVRTTWRRELRRAGRREIGGVLLGEAVAEATFRVLKISVQNTGGTTSRFIRDPAQHRQSIDAFFARTNHDYARFNYLGEWHSHPSYPTRPSPDDVRAMEDILADVDMGATFACLMIVKLTLFRRLEIGSYLFAPGYAVVPLTVERER